MDRGPEKTDTPAATGKDAGRGGYLIRGRMINAPQLDPGLYVVATPIGNLSDITVRALDTLAAADFIACEDTRVTRKLLGRYGIQATLLSYHDYSDYSRIDEIAGLVASGSAVALVSDAGTPLISDPGYRLVDRLRRDGRTVTPVPGASSLLAALAGAGLPTDTIHFRGFVAAKQGERRRQMGELARLNATIVLMESPRRLAASLRDAADIFGRETVACVCRELTKLHETFDRAPLGELAERHAAAGTARGEIVLVVHSTGARRRWADSEIDKLLVAALRTVSVRQAADQVAAETGLPRRAIYQRALKLKDGGART